MRKQFRAEFIKLSKPTPMLIAQITGPLDSVSIDRFVEQVYSFIETGYTRLIFNCADLDYINSTAIKEILNIFQDVKKENGFLYLVAVNRDVSEILHLVGVNQIIPIVDTHQEVLSKIQ